ncbi:HAMP domain-containing sensor histidine kinase [Plantibacter sp. YIM 135347]|uniref:HAMP domain-containing sensor histidine kinase n=1 Tax=Plantibacter sp. YIM 135347 TaxID=3423919 RepID=UPI003D32F089
MSGRGTGESPRVGPRTANRPTPRQASNRILEAPLHERPRRLTVRARLTLTYSALFTGAGALMLGIVYVFMRYVPTYAIQVDQRAVAATRSYPMESFADTIDPATGLPIGMTGVQPVSGTATDSFAQTSPLLITDQSDILNTLLVVSVIVLIVLALGSSWAGWVISGRVLRPLQEINLAAQRAATGSFDHRVALTGPRDEITELSDTFDHMLERLDRSFHAHRRFAANASHELRTPLATTQTMLDVAARDDELDLERTRELLSRLRTTNSRSIETVESLLDLADIGQREMDVEPIALTGLIEDVVIDAQDDAAERGITIDTDLAPAVVLGEATLVAQVVSNLVGNAIRHNHDGGTVSVRTRLTGGPDGGAPELTITNTGTLVPESAIPMLTEPFYRDSGRVATGRQRSLGLGLAIVDSIVTAHNGTLALRPNDGGGLVAVVTFPPVRTEREIERLR